MNVNPATWNAISERIKAYYTAANTAGYLNSVGFGDPNTIVSVDDNGKQRVDLHYPLLWGELEYPLPVYDEGKFTRWYINIWTLDAIESDESNLQYALSDMATIFQDCIAWLRNDGTTQGYSIESIETPTQIKDSTTDKLGGWKTRIVIRTAQHPGMCYVNQ